MRFAFIEQHAATDPVRLMCRVLEVSASGYYAWRARPESPQAASNRQLVNEIRRIETRHHGRYGSPRMHAARAEPRAIGAAAAGSSGSCAAIVQRHSELARGRHEDLAHL